MIAPLVARLEKFLDAAGIFHRRAAGSEQLAVVESGQAYFEQPERIALIGAPVPFVHLIRKGKAQARGFQFRRGSRRFEIDNPTNKLLALRIVVTAVVVPPREHFVHRRCFVRHRLELLRNPVVERFFCRHHHGHRPLGVRHDIAEPVAAGLGFGDLA